MISQIMIAGAVTSLAALVRFITTKTFSYFDFPFGTIFINIIGSFLLGLANHWLINDASLLLVVSAFISGYTTFSTFINESLQLGKLSIIKFSCYFGLTVILGLVFAELGDLI